MSTYQKVDLNMLEKLDLEIKEKGAKRKTCSLGVGI